VTRLGEGLLRRGTGGAGICADRTRCISVLVVLTIAVAFLLSSPLVALTPAGTSVSNTATGSYSGGSAPSNTVTFTVSSVAGLNVLAPISTAAGTPGTVIYYPIAVQNTGNSPDSVSLATSSTQGWSCVVYADGNGDGVHQPTETTVVAAATVPAGGQITCFVAVTIPAAAVAADAETVTATSGLSASLTTGASFTTVPIAPPVLPPTAAFSASVTSGIAPLTVSFTDQSTGGPTSWSWSFGDGGTSSQQNPTYQYRNVGTYTVSLTVSNTGGSNTKIQSALITVRAPTSPPTAAFSVSVTSGIAPLTVSFTDQSTGGPTSWSWSFGDGGTSSQQNPTYQYQNPGTYTVSLTVSNAVGSNTKTESALITVNPGAFVSFYGTPLSGVAPLTVSFVDQSGSSPTAWLWDFGDGSTSTLQNPTHIYTSPGTYSVRLTATTAVGTASKTFTGYVQVTTPAMSVVADFSATPLAGAAPLTVAFSDRSAGNPTSWSWSFGDGTTSAEQYPSHVYTSAGSYSVMLTIAGPGGTDSITRAGYIVVSTPPPVPVPDFVGAPTSGRVPLSVAFTDQTTGLDSTSTWDWDFGDGTHDSDQNPVHVYGKRGTFSVTLTVTNRFGPASQRQFNYIQVRRSSTRSYNLISLVQVPTDISENYWAFNEIMSLEHAGIIFGYPDGMFHPDQAVQRDQIAVFLARAVAGGDAQVPDGPPTPSFSDVPTDYWAYKYIEYAKAENIVTGYTSTLYGPTLPVNRAQMAVFLARSIVDPTGDAGLDGYAPPSTPTFRDVTPTNSYAWAYKHVEYLVSEGMVAGYPDGLYRPANDVSRDQMSVYIARAFGLVD
jgi:PKD repeat protein